MPSAWRRHREWWADDVALFLVQVTHLDLELIGTGRKSLEIDTGQERDFPIPDPAFQRDRPKIELLEGKLVRGVEDEEIQGHVMAQ